MAASNDDDGRSRQAIEPDEEGPLTLGGKPVREGDRIASYVFEREVGSGGMARVLLAHTPDGQQVALKVLRQSRFATGLARFRREFHALSRLDHPNIVAVHTYGDLHGHPYIAMEYVDGPDLHQVIRGFRQWEDEARFARCETILIDLCRALAAIHRRGLVHRDLKPSNILLTAKGVCKLTDFGIVKDLDPSRSPELSTTLVGTWAYTSPEHICGEPVDHRSDLYSLGVILFAMLTGKRPFAADSMAGYLEAHRDRPAPRASQIRPGVPAHLDEICTRLLAKSPRDRFQSAQEILYRLEADDPESRADVSDAWEPPLVGNQAAVEAIEEAVFSLTDGRGGVLRLLAEDGLGKSRLLQVAVDRARMLGLPFHQHAFHGHAPVYGVAIRLARELLRELSEEDGAELRKMVASWSDGEALRGDTRYALYDALRSALSRLLDDGPRVLLLDDVHEAEPQEAELVRFLARHLVGADKPLLLVITGRPQGEAGSEAWNQGLTPTTWHLGPLSEDDLVVIVASLIEPTRPAQALAHRLHAETEGNPLFAAEFLRSLMAQGLLVRTDDGWRLAIDPKELASGRLEIPPGIRDVLRKRIDAVAADDREVLEALALAGQPTDLDVLLDVLDAEDEVVLQRLDRLILGGLIREHRRADDLAYEVTHKKVSELLRRDIPETKARALYRAMAIALEATQAHDPATLQVIGELYRRAGDAARAYEHLVGAARRLVDRSMPEEAWTLTEHAVEVELAARADLDDARFADLRALLLPARAKAQSNRGAWTAAATTWRELADLASDPPNPRLAVDAAIGLSRALRRTGDVDAALDAAQKALVTARAEHYRKGVAEALHALTGLAWDEGDLEQVEKLADEGLLITQGPELASQRAPLLMARSAAQATRGQLASSVHGMHEAEALFRELRMKPLRVIALTNIAELHTWQGETDEAWARADEALTAATGLGFALGRLAGLRARGMAALDLGRYTEAQDDLRGAVALASELAVDEERLAATVALVRLCLEQSDPEGALRHGAAALDATDGRDPERYLPLLHAQLARAIARRRSGAAWTLLQAVDDALPTLHTPRRLQVLLAASWAWLALGDKTRAIQLTQELVRTPAARSFRLITLEARMLLGSTTTGEEARRHRRIGAELAREFADNLPITTGDDVRRRPVFRYFAEP